MRVQGSALLKWRAFTEADLRSKSAQRAKSVPRRGTLLEGGSPTCTVSQGKCYRKNSLALVPIQQQK